MKNNKISPGEGRVQEQGGLSSNIIFSGRVSFQCNQTGCMVSGDPMGCMDPGYVSRVDGGYFDLVYASAHCHSPACLSVELWDDDTGELLCRNEPTYGNGSAPIHDELGFAVGIAPCLFGDAEEGLRTPPRLHLTSNLTTIKRTNNTYGHWGVMALWQNRAAYVTNPNNATGQ